MSKLRETLGDARSRKRERGRGSSPEEKSEPAMAGWIGRSGCLFEREDRTSWFFLTLPNSEKGGKRWGYARCRKSERGRRSSLGWKSEPGNGGTDRQIDSFI